MFEPDVMNTMKQIMVATMTTSCTRLNTKGTRKTKTLLMGAPRISMLEKLKFIFSKPNRIFTRDQTAINPQPRTIAWRKSFRSEAQLEVPPSLHSFFSTCVIPAYVSQIEVEHVAHPSAFKNHDDD